VTRKEFLQSTHRLLVELAQKPQRSFSMSSVDSGKWNTVFAA